MAGQALGDFLAATVTNGGINRPALNAQVNNSIATNGLRTAQTDVAIGNAKKLQDEANARDSLVASIQAAKGPDGQPLASPEEAELIANEQKAGYGDFKTANEGFGQLLRNHLTSVASDPNNLNKPAQTAALVGLTNKAPEAVTVPDNYYVPPGMAKPDVQQSPLGAAKAHAQNALATLNTTKSDAGGFAPHAGAASMTPDQQQKMQTLLGAGYIGPTQMYSFAKNPGLIDAAFGAYNNDPTGSIGLAHAKQALLTNISSGTMQKGLLAGNTAIAHMGLLPQAVDALNNGDVSVLNKLFNGFNAATGTPAPVLAQQLSQFLGREVVNAVQANGGTGPEREAAEHIFDNAGAPQTLLDSGRQAAQLLSGRLHGVEQDFMGTMSMGQPGTEEKYRQQFRSRFLTPDTRRSTGMTLPDEGTDSFGPNQVLPDYKDEAAALAAGHKPGERVSIGGIPGRLQ